MHILVMEGKEACLRLGFVVLVVNLAVGVLSSDEYNRHDFPTDFVFGAGTTAYQVEGAANEDGRTPSVWDTFAHSASSGENGDVACDGYHKYKGDVQLMVETGLEAYRFSISWSRLIPNGRGPVNPKGVEYYNNLINELISNGIEPHVTLNNHDFPQALEDEYNGWLSPKIIRDFTYYADVCFREFGDRVKYWTTVNEPNTFAINGYDSGKNPPQHCSPPFCAGKAKAIKGNSTTEPYLALHHILLSHSSAVSLYRRKYKDKQHGFVGISIYAYGAFPNTTSEKDRIATQRVRDFLVGWIMEPLLHGDYPVSMKQNAGARIPTFTDSESKQVKGAYDFIGLIHYFSVNVSDNPDALNNELRDFEADMGATVTVGMDPRSNEGLPVAPWGLKEELNKFRLNYGNPPIFIHENGQKTLTNSSLQDISRVNYLHRYIGAVLDSLRNGVNVKGYFVWSFMDLFEISNGYDTGFGLYYVDRNDPELKRYPRLSAKWYNEFLRSETKSMSEIIKIKENSWLISDNHLFE